MIQPKLKSTQPTLFLLIDNLRWDQWKTIEPYINQIYQKIEERFTTVFCLLLHNMPETVYLLA